MPRADASVASAGGNVPVLARARIAPATGRRSAPLERVGRLTPYALELLVEDALCAGPGARLDIALPADSDAACLAATAAQLARLARRGVEVSVRREAQPGHTTRPAA